MMMLKTRSGELLTARIDRGVAENTVFRGAAGPRGAAAPLKPRRGTCASATRTGNECTHRRAHSREAQRLLRATICASSLHNMLASEHERGAGFKNGPFRRISYSPVFTPHYQYSGTSGGYPSASERCIRMQMPRRCDFKEQMA